MSQEDRIQEALKALAAEDAGKQASAGTEAEVLAEFRRLNSEKLSVKAAETVPERQPPAHWYRPAFWALAGAAAMFVAVLGWQGWASNIGAGTPPEQTVTRSVVAPEILDLDVLESSAASRAAESGVDLAAMSSSQEPRERSGIPPPSAPVRNAPRRRAGQVMQAAPASLTKGPQAPNPGPRTGEPLVPPSVQPGASPMEEPLTTLPGTGEVATDFFPLLEVIPPFERGRILRTTVPASTMREVGLWVHPDRLYEPVEADVLVGNDGIARAIRFVGRAPDGDSAVPPVDRQ